jgi:CRISPR-associated endonuclease/helicase Cas3
MSRPFQWPWHLQGLLGKSAAYGGDTLAEHTWQVLYKLAELYRLRPRLAFLGQPSVNLWHCLFWACWLHDFGKVATGFQAMLRGGDLWKRRHEVVSLLFLDWIAEDLSDTEQTMIGAAIAAHHRDASVIGKRYPTTCPQDFAPLVGELHREDLLGLWQWIDECSSSWIQALHFEHADVHTLSLLSREEAVRNVLVCGTERLAFRLDQYQHWVNEFLTNPVFPPVLISPLLFRGLTITADHMASAHLQRLLPALQEPWPTFATRTLPGKTIYAHQTASAEHCGRSALLIAPTGSGKTDAALAWILGDGTGKVPRLFYVLPYQASMNAMWKRLQKSFAPEMVGLQHGRAEQSLYLTLLHPKYHLLPEDAARRAHREKNMNQLHARPIVILSPYQLLKAVFQLKGFEAMLANYAQAAFVFDEIHAYEPKRLALILVMIRYFREYLEARFFIMSATFPTMLQKRIEAALALDSVSLIPPDPESLSIRRHHLLLLPGNLLSHGLKSILADFRQGKQVLVCLNSVPRARQVYEELKRQEDVQGRIVLIHSRYMQKHRFPREQQIQEECGVEMPSARPFIVVGTQVVEVSLDIDLDVIYTDPAPLEALLQRFGRINRKGFKPVCPVFVFRQPNSGQGIYMDELVQATLWKLDQFHDQDIEEASITGWLDAIYQLPTICDAWERAYDEAEQDATMLLQNLRPFESNPQSEQEFEAMFDSVEVVPEAYVSHYLQALEREQYLEANQYLVSIKKKDECRLYREGKIAPLVDQQGKWCGQSVLVSYTEEHGLLLHD